jgi:hypothetical protein
MYHNVGCVGKLQEDETTAGRLTHPLACGQREELVEVVRGAPRIISTTIL